jgi:hypothetical protein
MDKTELLTTASVLELFNVRGLYSVGYSLLFGSSVWATFIAGPIAFKTLPRHQFGNLQHKTFPYYFSLSVALSTILSAVWVSMHPQVAKNITSVGLMDVAQLYTIASVGVAQGINLLVVGPLTSKVMFERHKQEKSEGKTYSEAGISDEMRALNKRFGMLHGISSLLNLQAVLALGFHGLWIGNAGVKGI